MSVTPVEFYTDRSPCEPTCCELTGLYVLITTVAVSGFTTLAVASAHHAGDETTERIFRTTLYGMFGGISLYTIGICCKRILCSVPEEPEDRSESPEQLFLTDETRNDCETGTARPRPLLDEEGDVPPQQ